MMIPSPPGLPTSETLRPLRIVQVVNVRWFNATAWYGITLSRLLKDAGHDVLLLGLEGTASFARAQEMGLSPVAMPMTARNPLMQPVLLNRLGELLGSFKPDIVNCHRGESCGLFGLLKRRLGFALVRTRGDQRLPRNTYGNRKLHASVADAVIATNSRIETFFLEKMDVPRENLHKVLGGVDTRAFSFDAEGRERVRAEFGFSADEPVVGLLGRFDTVKGQKELLEAGAMLRQRGLPVRIFLVGHDSVLQTAELAAFAESTGMAAHTIFTGRRPDVAACLSAMDVGVVASLYSEAIARAALELMACGRPLVSTSVGVMPDLLPPEALCGPGNVPALADRIGRVLRDGPFCAALREDSARRLSGLSLDAFLDKTLHIYTPLAQRARSGRAE